MKRKKLFIFIVLIFCLLGCIKNDEELEKKGKIVNVLIKNKLKFKLREKDFFRIKRVVYLVLNSVLISEVSKVFFINNNIYILDRKYSNFLVFNRNGNFLFSIGKIGQGEGEFTRLFDVDYDETNKRFVFYCNNDIKVIYYSLNGLYLKSKKINFFAYNIGVLNSNKYLFYINYNSSNENKMHNVVVTDSNILTKDLLFKYDSKETPSFSFTGFLQRNRSGFLYSGGLENTIYQIDGNKAFPKYFIDFGKYNCPSDVMKNHESVSKKLLDYSYVENTAVEADSCLFFSYVHNRKTNKAFWLDWKDILIQKEDFLDNVFLKIISNPICITNDGFFLVSVDPEVYFEYIKENPRFETKLLSQFPELHKCMSSLKEYSNPVLIVFEINKNAL